ncbi:hypothetical protein HDF16_005973 [Granulicella aggregans]|uniref:Uncharacterized protein n=1 Tax=Granulicella aggregans TaxID=474949 RepID=A0A7W7ZJS7_9BACT|nr:hypothetical protein [Granulicella aggregans]
MLFASLRSPSLRALTITVATAAATFSVPAFAAPSSRAMYQALVMSASDPEKGYPELEAVMKFEPS